MDKYDDILDKEIEKRIEEMEEPDHEFPKRFSGKDYVFTAAVGILCLAAVIWGAFI